MNLFQAVITPALQHDKRTSQAKNIRTSGQLEVSMEETTISEISITGNEGWDVSNADMA